MPLYEYRCRACGADIEALRTVAEADAPAACACGAGDTVRLPSRIAPATGASEQPGPGSGPLPMAGGCCGGACGCG